LGGVGTKPWRAVKAEQILMGARATDQSYQAAAEAALREARTHKYNAFKVELARRTLVRTLAIVGGTG
jgi:xanthine dehydrogenase YagS FAD-binding subunit